MASSFDCIGVNIISRIAVPALNHVLAASPWATERLHQHAGVISCVEAGPVVLNLQITAEGLFRAVESPMSVDVTITLPSDFPLKVLVDRGEVFRSARLSGKADVAETLAFVFRNLKWDAEADLADLIGDIPAHRLAGFGRAVARQVAESGRRAVANVSEYVGEESGAMATPDELESFGRAVDSLRDDLARLEKRIGRLV